MSNAGLQLRCISTMSLPTLTSEFVVAPDLFQCAFSLLKVMVACFALVLMIITCLSSYIIWTVHIGVSSFVGLAITCSFFVLAICIKRLAQERGYL